MVRQVINEFKRLFYSRTAILIVLITSVIPFAGLYSKLFILGRSSNTDVLLAPAKLGALLGSVLSAVFTIYEIDRVYRSGVSSISEATVSMIGFNVSKVLAVIILAIIACISAALIFLPYAFYRLGSIYNLSLYLFSFFIIMLPAIGFSILLISGMYMIFRRLDISLLIYGALSYVSCNVENNYLAVWLQTNIPVYSDSFGNDLAVRSALWNRLVWLLLSIAVFIFGVLSNRRYEKSIFRSILVNIRMVYLPVCVFLFAVSCCIAGFCEPCFDDSPDIKYTQISDQGSGMSFVQTTTAMEKNEDIIVENADANVFIDTRNAAISGTVAYTLRNTSGKQQELSISINPGYQVKTLKINGLSGRWQDLNTIQNNSRLFKIKLPANEGINLEIVYGGKHRLWRLLQSTLGGGEVISNNFINLNGKSLIPSLLAVSKSCKYSGKVTLPSGLTLVTSGGTNYKVSQNPVKDTVTWSFHSSGGMVALYAGKYDVQNIRAGDIDIEFYYNHTQANIVKNLKAVGIIKDAVNYYTDLLGTLEYSKDNPLKIVENSALMLGGGAFGNISTIGETILSSDFLASSDHEGSNGVEVLAHELCHQWWGVETHFPQSVSKWSSEGLTVFTTWKFLQHEFGAAYADRTGIDNWKSELESLKRNFYYRNPDYRKVIPEKYLFNILSRNNAIITYSQMPYEIYKAEQLLGEKSFEKVLSKVYRRYKNELTLEEFLTECKLTEEEIAVD